MSNPTDRRIEYAGCVHDERGDRGRRRGAARRADGAAHRQERARPWSSAWPSCSASAAAIMCNSGSSALYLAVELLGLEPGDEIITVAAHLLHRHRADGPQRARAGVRRRRARHLPDRRRRHRGDDRPADEGDPRPEPHRQRPRLGRHPRDRRPPRPAGGRGLVRRPRPRPCGARRPAPAPTSRSPASPCRTSSPRPAPAAWCASTTTALADRALLLRRWGRRSEVQIFGSAEGRRAATASSATIDGDLEYDNLFIFDEVGWNFEPSELSRGVRRWCSSTSCPTTSPAASATSTSTGERLRPVARRVRRSPASPTGVETGWHMFPILIRPGVGHPPRASSSSAWRPTASTPAWCGRATSPRQPGVPGHRAPGRPTAACPTPTG